jgi:hypothetical protein
VWLDKVKVSYKELFEICSDPDVYVEELEDGVWLI